MIVELEIDGSGPALAFGRELEILGGKNVRFVFTDLFDSRPGGIRIGIGESEFFIKGGVTGRIFRAKRVRQSLLDHRDENRQYESRVQFLDLDTGFVCVTRELFQADRYRARMVAWQQFGHDVVLA